MKIWVTTYALTEGIKEYDAKPTHQPVMMEFAPNRYVLREGKNWHRTYEAALDKAEHIRLAKICSLRVQIAKLEALRFPQSAA